MAQGDEPSLGDKQPVFVELIVAVCEGKRESDTIQVADGVAVRARKAGDEQLDISIVLDDPIKPNGAPPTLGQNAAGRLIGDIQLSLKTVFDIPMAIEPDFRLRENENQQDSGVVVYGTRLRFDGTPVVE